MEASTVLAGHLYKLFPPVSQGLAHLAVESGQLGGRGSGVPQPRGRAEGMEELLQAYEAALGAGVRFLHTNPP